LADENSTLYNIEKSSYLANSTVSFMIGQLFWPMSNRFTAMFRSLYH